MRFLSLFSGIEAASVAWKPLGWTCVGVSEIDKAACKVLAYRFPDVPNLGDVTKISEDQIKALGPIDVVVGGWPCQDLSIAGKGKGIIKGETRSGLFYDAHRIVKSARAFCGCRYAVLENVPGLLSNRGGADFAAVVNALLGTDFGVPDEGWQNSGVAVGPEGLLEWATLDAQFFGVPQRRRRVFIILSFGDWRNRPPILLERESLRGDITPRREKGERVADSITVGANQCSGFPGDFVEQQGGIASLTPSEPGQISPTEMTPTRSSSQVETAGTVDAAAGRSRGAGSNPGLLWPAEVAPTLNAAFGEKQGLENQHINEGGVSSCQAIVMATGQAGAEIGMDQSPSLTCNHEAPILAQGKKHDR